MLPLSDNHPTRALPLLTWALVAACVVVFLLQLGAGGGSPAAQQATIFHYGFIPALTLGQVFHGALQIPAQLLEPIRENPGWPAILSSMFMHGGWAHLGGNMLYLYIFGDNIEDRLGKGRFLLFYLLTGAAAALTQAVTDPTSTVPMVGASGAISGILGGYLVLYPRQQVTVIAPYLGLTQVPAVMVLGLWFVGQLTQSLAITPGSGGVAFWAHIGGFIAGAVLIKIFAIGRQSHANPVLRAARQTRPQLWQ